LTLSARCAYNTDMTNPAASQTTAPRYSVLTTGPKCHYVYKTTQGILGLGFTSKRAAQVVVDARNAEDAAVPCG
jgi:hypothetical protein